ncbi:Zn(II)2Cys6 transcription factor [Aspergillus aculeatinus CBS 121060]|uniref:C6 and C2H2 transcription factor n=1 Tax=Aspergillus aculeatinus CBS 121060 TaxID=1448322 RepID=A0ACD1H8N5_9EURO|nr:C6 and C2H2 transcription factor [Aspergillus aculeatinus CBS 121060]RAH69870.1 C6 and C2H2 transcription factor [Aspergillus aculeatinus CBS 121060]
MPSQANARPAKSRFPCVHPGCRATYQRKEHLNRHLARHDRAHRFCCPHCSSTLARRDDSPTDFSSSDLLRRHVRIYHPDRQPPSARTPKACSNCHARKERCDGGSPCARCARRGASCSRNPHLDLAHEEGCENVSEPRELLSVDLVASVADASRWIGHEYIDIYFNKFHPIWPFLHRTTFYPAKEPCILLQSMLMMGLWIKGDREARHTAMKFHDRLLSAIRAQKDQWHVPESMGNPDDSKPWPMATYQSILLQLIFAVLTAKPEVQLDLNCRFRLPEPTYELLTALVATCRRLGLFSYPNMLARHHPTAPVALVWVSVEETKRFGLALYKLCRLCSSSTSTSRANTDSGADELLTLADLDFSMPDSDDWWNVASTTDASTPRHTGWHSTARDNRNPGGWISQASAHLRDPGVRLDWI